MCFKKVLKRMPRAAWEFFDNYLYWNMENNIYSSLCVYTFLHWLINLVKRVSLPPIQWQTLQFKHLYYNTSAITIVTYLVFFSSQWNSIWFLPLLQRCYRQKGHFHADVSKKSHFEFEAKRSSTFTRIMVLYTPLFTVNFR